MTQSVQSSASSAEAELVTRAQDLVQRALDAGATQAEVYARRDESTSVTFEKGDLKLTQVDGSAAIGLRVVVDHKLGFASTNQAADASLDQVAKDAVSLARMSPADEHNVLPEPGGAPAELDLSSGGAGDLSIEEAVEVGRQLVAECVAIDPRLSLDKADFGTGRAHLALATSTGIEVARSVSGANLSVFGMAIDGDDVGGFDYWGEHVRVRSDIPAAVNNTATRFGHSAVGNLGAGAAESYKGTVLFAPDAFLDIFVGPLTSGASAIAVQRGRSALAGKIGKQIAGADFSVIDDPTDLDLAGARPFDREGQPARRFALIDNGVLGGYFHNAYSAHVDGTTTTGHAAGGARAVPGLGPHAITVAGGDAGERDAMLATLGRGLLVNRFSGSVDAASGDFSGVAKSARWIENGEEVRPVQETLISGNLFELLKGQIALGSTPEIIMGAARAPWALVDGISVTAG
jgi:PmbA protein